MWPISLIQSATRVGEKEADSIDFRIFFLRHTIPISDFNPPPFPPLPLLPLLPLPLLPSLLPLLPLFPPLLSLPPPSSPFTATFLLALLFSDK